MVLNVYTYICVDMKIEEVIKQTKGFRTPIDKVLVNIHYTAMFLSAQHASLLKGFNVSSQQYNVLRILKGKYPESVTVKYLIERMMDKSSNASRLVDKLYQKGYVVREQNETDRRQLDVKISETGIQLLEDCNKVVNDNSDSIEFSEEDALVLSDLLDKFREQTK